MRKARTLKVAKPLEATTGPAPTVPMPQQGNGPRSASPQLSPQGEEGLARPVILSKPGNGAAPVGIPITAIPIDSANGAGDAGLESAAAIEERRSSARRLAGKRGKSSVSPMLYMVPVALVIVAGLVFMAVRSEMFSTPEPDNRNPSVVAQSTGMTRPAGVAPQQPQVPRTNPQPQGGSGSQQTAAASRGGEQTDTSLPGAVVQGPLPPVRPLPANPADQNGAAGNAPPADAPLSKPDLVSGGEPTPAAGNPPSDPTAVAGTPAPAVGAGAGGTGGASDPSGAPAGGAGGNDPQQGALTKLDQSGSSQGTLPTQNIPSESMSSQLGGRAGRKADTYKSGYSNAEPTVEAGLNWLAHHQLADGGWSFEHRIGECQGRCGDPGTMVEARIAATGLALLPFLGAGYNHMEGPYHRTIAGGLRYLMARESKIGSLWEPGGQMYGHGIATLALCEAVGVAKEAVNQPAAAGGPNNFSLGNKDPNGPQIDPKEKAQEKKEQQRQQALDKALRIDPRALTDAARRAIRFILQAQNVEGGWRYQPGQAGDMSVAGWQIMALASGQQAGFGFDPATRNRAVNYMKLSGGDYQGDENYGRIPTVFAYLPPVHEKNGTARVSQATTAIGLLALIYMGVHPQHPGMEVAVQRLVQSGPNLGNMYYTYYANQVLYQHGGNEWETWRQMCEPRLMACQAKVGHLEGSWQLFGDLGASKGGRTYSTVMALLCLEENYRHMRIFNQALGKNQPIGKGQLQQVPGAPNPAAGVNPPGQNPLGQNPAAQNPGVQNPAVPNPGIGAGPGVVPGAAGGFGPGGGPAPIPPPHFNPPLPAMEPAPLRNQGTPDGERQNFDPNGTAPPR